MDWEIYDGQLQRGPMPEAGVFDAIRNGLPRNAYVRQAGTSDWLPIDTHPLFATVLQHRPAPGQWAPPPPPPPPALIGTPPPAVPEVPRPPPGTAYAVSGNATQRARPTLVARGCLVQALGSVLLIAAGYGIYAQVAALVVVAAVAIVGLVLLGVGGLLGLAWVCSACKQPVARKGAFMCPSCRASFT
jgi:hypothetical protein